MDDLVEAVARAIKHQIVMDMQSAREAARTMSEREQGAVLALQCGNGLATHYWRKQAIAARHHLTKDSQA